MTRTIKEKRREEKSKKDKEREVKGETRGGQKNKRATLSLQRYK